VNRVLICLVESRRKAKRFALTKALENKATDELSSFNMLKCHANARFLKRESRLTPGLVKPGLTRVAKTPKLTPKFTPGVTF